MTRARHVPRWNTIAATMLLLPLLAACGGTTEQATPTTAPVTQATAATERSSVAATTAEAGSTTMPGMDMTATTDETATTSATTTGADTSATTTGATGATGDTAAEPPLNADVSGTVNVWHFWGSPVRRNGIRRVVAICQQKLPNIQITETFKPFGDIYTAHVAAVAAGSGMADVIVEDRPQLPQRAADQIDISLQEYATRDGIDGEAFFPFTWNQTLYEGNTYGIPYETDVRVLYYNKTAFEEVGLDPNAPPTTWAELEEYADKLDKRDGDTIERMAFSPLIGNVGADVWGLTNGVELIDEQLQPHINDPAFVETLTWMKQWLDRYGGWQNHQNFRANFTAPPNDEFMSGRVAMKVDTNGYASQLNAFRPRVTNAAGESVEMQWGVAQIPYNTEPASTSGGFALSIPRGSPNADAAWEFIKCATGAEAQTSWARDTYSIPARTAVANDAVLLADPNWQFFVDAMDSSSSGYFVPNYPNWNQELANRYEQVWSGELDPQAAATEAQDAIVAETGQ